MLGDWIALIVLGFLWGVQVFLRPFRVSYIRVARVISIALIFCLAFYWSWAQYETWTGTPFASIAYFSKYAGLKFFGPPVIALLAAWVFSRVLRWMNRRYENRFFEEEEIPTASLCVFLTGYPLFFLYLIIVLIEGLVFSLLYSLLSKGRVPLYHVWLPTALFVIIMKIYFLPAVFLAPFTLR
ncbi:hypothetical protein C4571_00375 [Candidatus Parcubacteria bacterium]|nr:MAG: hypothetical protein C4571_00375 [Candidatus Parcubacteria bacterium]